MSNEYLTRAELKATLDIATADTYADADIDMALEAASRVIDGYKQTRFYPTSGTAFYTGDPCKYQLDIDDMNTVTSVAVDADGDGTYETTWSANTDYYTEPINGPLYGYPYTTITIRTLSGKQFPSWQHSVRVVGSFGWSTAVPQVKQACKILSSRYLKRARETPYGILTVVGDAVAAAHLGRIDPDVAALLDSITANPPRLLR